jgi:hypothetical protein
MKCKKCKNEKIRILGKEYCPTCSSNDFNIKKHSGEKYISENSVRAILWGVASSFLLTFLVIFFIRTFVFSTEIPSFILIFLGFLCFGSAGALTVFIDEKYYVKDNFIISVLLSLSISIVDWYFYSASYVMTFFSSLLVLFVTISIGSLLFKTFVNKDE